MPPSNAFTRKASIYRNNFIRLVDKAVNEYKLAREYLVAEIRQERGEGDGPAGITYIYFIGVTDHLENCVNATRRASALFERLNGEGTISEIPRETRRLLSRLAREVVQLRHVIEHIDEKIHSGEADAGPTQLIVRGDRDRATISGYELKLSQLASLLTRFHELGVYLIGIATTI